LTIVPPTSCLDVGRSQGYDEVMTKGHWCPPRLCGRNDSLVEAVNDWHFAMLHLGNKKGL